MSPTPPDIAVVDPLDRELEAMLDSCGFRTRRLMSAELMPLVHPAAQAPDVLVADLRGGRQLPAAVASIKRQHPDLGVLVVGSTTDPATMLEAMRAGAGEFLAEPLTAGPLEQAVRRLVAHKPAAHTAGAVFAFIGAKGGVGATTTCVNVATALAARAKRQTLLIDLHLANGDAAVYLGAEPRFSIVDAIENTHRFDEAFFRGLVTSTKPGPDLLASADNALVPSTGAPQYQSVIEFGARVYRYVVLDVPRSNAAALDALDTATAIVVLANQELPTVRSAAHVAGMLRQRYGKDRVRVAMTRYDAKAEISPEDVGRALSASVKHLVPSDYRLAITAINRGRPLVLDNHSRLAAAYRDLAYDLAGIDSDFHKPPTSSLFGRLTGRG
jgi:pilus assembly protein CpaE